jgi:serine/threonine protein kinase
MFEDESDDAEVKLIDFGLSKKFLGKPGYMTERVGTMYVLSLKRQHFAMEH